MSDFTVILQDGDVYTASIDVDEITITVTSPESISVSYSDGIGARGEKGDKGEKGDPGENGSDGYTPVKGVDYFDGAKGDKGDTGEQGPQGIQGIQGLKGDTGDQGPQGETGPAGPAAAWGNITGTLSSQTDLQAALNNKADILSRKSCFIIESDFFSTNVSAACPGLLGAALSSGTVGAVSGSANHPGVIYLRDSTTANGGYRFMTEVTSFLIAGGEKSIFTFQARGVRSTASFRLGWQDSTAIQTAPTDGIWLEGVGNGTNVILTGKCKNNAGPTNTASTYTLSSNTWVTAVIDVNSDASQVSFYLYNDSGTLLWSDTVSANIPKASGRETGFGVIVGETTTDAAAHIIHLDYLRMEINRTLTR